MISSLLVLSDGECGEFAYKLCGEVLPPATSVEHKAKVGLEGTQVEHKSKASAPASAASEESSPCLA